MNSVTRFRSDDIQIAPPVDLRGVPHHVDELGRVVIVQKEDKPWGKIMTGAVAIVFMLVSFKFWIVQEVMKSSQLAAARAHELSVKSIELAQQTSKASSDLDLGLIFVAAMIIIALAFICKGSFK